MRDELYIELYDLIKDAFIEMQELVKTSKENHKFIFSHHDFPRIDRYRENGMPSLSTYFFTDGPSDFASLFKSDDEYHYSYEKLPVFQRILRFFMEYKDEFMEHPYFRDIKRKPDLYQRIFAFDLLDAFDSYMHEAADDTFSEDAFREVLLRLYNRFFARDLSLSICIPILITRFEADEYIVSDGIRIRKLTEPEIISSYQRGGYSDTYELLTVSSATHILELQNYSVENAPVFAPIAWDYEEAYPVEIVDKWFAAYRIVTHHDTGYGQLLMFPQNWGVREANLINIQGVKITRFPTTFVKKQRYTDSTPLVTNAELEAVGKLFKSLLDNSVNSLNIAVRRLNMAYLRESDEDTIIDLMIGIEALVTKKDMGEITYKVSTRVAWILSTLSDYPYSIKETFSLMKKIYNFRSKVVHGEAITEKLRIIKLREDAEISSVDLARNILENLILAVTERREFLDPSNIDEFFFEKYELMKEINDWKQADCGDGVISETD